MTFQPWVCLKFRMLNSPGPFLIYRTLRLLPGTGPAPRSRNFSRHSVHPFAFGVFATRAYKMLLYPCNPNPFDRVTARPVLRAHRHTSVPLRVRPPELAIWCMVQCSY